jgi:starch phosphorylase
MASGRVSETQAKPRIAESSYNVRTGLEADAIATALIENLNCLQGKLPQHAMRND